MKGERADPSFRNVSASPYMTRLGPSRNREPGGFSGSYLVKMKEKVITIFPLQIELAMGGVMSQGHV